MIGVKPEPSKRLSFDPDGEPTSPAAADGVASASQIYSDFIALERHPVDAALTQSSSRRCQWRRALGDVLVRHDGDPL
ncbi:hypothetical protein [Actinomadura sp. KC216]|uniref:hypothetical protein n=1 Tax=Actinomadura sp. KC216 TaxID=2530370 RepID=UPI0014055DB9|nr:hypothetical protein [Actinomadura sp. KC216]